MVKLVALLKKPESMSREEFVDWWINVHAPIIRRAPGLRRYVISPTLAGSRRLVEYDGIAELWFDDVEAGRRGLSAPGVGDAGQQDVATHGIQRIMFFTDEHTIVE